eukprot:ANDGO_08285.mRNA.1 hypothetical protein PPTG_01106
MGDRHYCKFCNVFIQNDKVSRLSHESGHRHKENVSKYLESALKHAKEKTAESKPRVEAVTQQSLELQEHLYGIAAAANRAPFSITRKPPPTDAHADKLETSLTEKEKWDEEHVRSLSSSGASDAARLVNMDENTGLGKWVIAESKHAASSPAEPSAVKHSASSHPDASSAAPKIKIVLKPPVKTDAPITGSDIKPNPPTVFKRRRTDQ